MWFRMLNESYGFSFHGKIRYIWIQKGEIAGTGPAQSEVWEKEANKNTNVLKQIHCIVYFFY